MLFLQKLARSEYREMSG